MLSDDILYVALLYCIQYLYYYSTVHKINNIVTKQQEDVTSHYSTPNISGGTMKQSSTMLDSFE